MEEILVPLRLLHIKKSNAITNNNMLSKSTINHVDSSGLSFKKIGKIPT